MIEAIVALVIISAALIPLYALHSTSMRSLFRVAETNEVAVVKRNALAFVAAMNPSVQPTGTENMGGYTLTWSSEVLAGPVPGSAYPVGIGSYDLALYRIDVRIANGTDPDWLEFSVSQLGYEKVRDPASSGPP